MGGLDTTSTTVIGDSSSQRSPIQKLSAAAVSVDDVESAVNPTSVRLNLPSEVFTLSGDKAEQSSIAKQGSEKMKPHLRPGNQAATGSGRSVGVSSAYIVPPPNVPSGKDRKVKNQPISRALSWHEDSTQCMFCLRRILKADSKHHTSVCELRTELCRY